MGSGDLANLGRSGSKGLSGWCRCLVLGGGIMIGTFEAVEFTLGQFGQQYTTIDGTKYITYFDLLDRKLRGLKRGVKVEFTTTPAPTILCHSPHVEMSLPSADIHGVVEGRQGAWA